ncbi:phospholipase D-like domain-containing protein [Myxosarcina sp. GI1]|uniref:phospholipase D-like domain-containing protein n=1 Tax=Myxosarcina sp. GI1 TaxID=1541065 RepID=UPI00068E8298|nr:phospholipase D-like domain-containing protein [Myxosarcina sp. GI1]
MFLTSSKRPIDPELKNIVEDIEQKSPSLSVLAARQLRYCVFQTSIKIEISKSRQLNILEDFIFRAGIEFDPLPTEDELATVLGLDPIFIKNTTATLRNLHTLETETKSVIKLTSVGQEFYRDRSVPEAPEPKTIYAISEPLNNSLSLKSSPIEEREINHLQDLTDYVIVDDNINRVSRLSLSELRKLLIQNPDLEFHSPENGKFVTSFKAGDITETIWKTLSLIVIFDVLENVFRIQAREGKRVFWLDDLLAKDKINLNALCQLTDEEINNWGERIADRKNAEVEKRVEIIRQKALDNLRQQQQQSSSESINIEAGTAVQLRGGKISQELANILDSAQHQVLIYSPWISAKVVNDRFIKRLQNLANKGVWILIGYGIAQSEKEEERPIPEQVKEQLQSILTKEGISAVQAFWLGGSHAKELIVDRKVHLLGSNNLLSFRASSGLWDESVYKVTIPEQVQQAYEFYARRFKAKAEELWNISLENKNIELATQALCLWGALGMEEMALIQIKANDWEELYSVWISLVRQGIRAEKILPDSACFQQLKGLEQLSEQNSIKKSNKTYNL